MSTVYSNICIMFLAIGKTMAGTIGAGILFAVLVELWWAKREERKEPAKAEMIDLPRRPRKAA